MSNKVDFLFVYEIKSREAESIILLGNQLKKRGYTVAYINTWENMDYFRSKRYDAGVVIAFAAYNTSTIKFVLKFCKSVQKVVNMQWEQLLSNGDKSKKSYRYYFDGWAKKTVHLAWGENNYNRLVNECGIPARFVKKVGHIGTDFLRTEFKKYYKSREEICQEFSLDAESQICLFVSTFSFVGSPESIAALVDGEFITFSVESQKEIMNWFSKYISEHPKVTIIYRPHPAEKTNLKLLEFSKKNDNFRVISDYSIKQWITIADVIYNWYSTSVLEIFAAKKGCFILRPFDIPEQYEIPIFENAHFITSYEEFAASFEKEMSFPISGHVMLQYNFIEEETPVYIKIADCLTEILDNDEYIFWLSQKEKRNYLLERGIRKSKVFRLAKQIRKILGSKDKKATLHEMKNEKKYQQQMVMQNRMTEQEFQYYHAKLEEIVG